MRAAVSCAGKKMTTSQLLDSTRSETLSTLIASNASKQEGGARADDSAIYINPSKGMRVNNTPEQFL